jgi:CYTH domain-containing protein/CHAD domain-containing protein
VNTPRLPTSEDIDALLSSALVRPAAEGARIVALHWLHGLLAARADWATPPEPDAEPEVAYTRRAKALHKARVNLRRLRATLREHGPRLELDVGHRAARALRRLGKATNETRDRDVQQAWLVAHRDTVLHAASDEVDELLTWLRRGARRRDAVVSKTFARDLDAYAERLVERLARYTATVEIGRTQDGVLFADHLAACVRDGVEEIRRSLEVAGSVDDQQRLHRLRIQLKQQRAMLAAFSDADPAIAAWHALATQGQDLLGAMRDGTLLAERAERHHLYAVADASRAEALAQFVAFREQWIDASTTAMEVALAAEAALRRLAHQTRSAAAPGGSAARPEVIDGFAMPDGHGLPMEIERKYLLHGLPPRAAVAPSVRIEQGWLPGNVLRERLRRTIAANGTLQHTRTIKLGRPGARIEIEEAVEATLFDALWPHTVDARIRKRRHLVTDGPWTWEIDVFLDRDLVLAEIELDDAARQVELPGWLAPFVVRDVTHDPAYLNAVMAQRDVAVPERESR